MATVRPQKPAASARYDALVQEQLDRARRRIRLLDVSSALLVFVAGTLAYTLALGLLDRKFDFAPATRQVAFAAYALVAVVFLAVGVVRPLFRRVNPYYAARAVEAVVPGAKNSLVNWLDLHDESLPAAIRASLSQRAAKDLGRADLEQAISGRRAVWLTALTALLLLVAFGLLITSGTGGFGTLLARVFAPFGSGATAPRTQLTLLRPVNGDAMLGVGQPFDVAVRVEGRVPDPQKPDALKLLYRYRDGEPYEEQPLTPENGDDWMTVLPASRTFNGFRYKITGGDAQTAEYRVTVRSTPLIERFEVTYHYRPYTGWPDARTRDANLKALRGTEAEVIVHTNRPVKEGRLEVETREGKRNVPAELIADQPQALRARLVMEQNGQYRVWFTTTDNDSNLAALPYTIEVLADFPPKAELTEPGADVTLPANGTLRLKGSASDDIGVKELTLHLRQVDGPTLQSQPYRPEKPLRLGEQGYPKKVDYEDFVALDQVKDGQGQPFALAKGTVLEYWLEAADACDFPEPHRAESKHFKVNVTEPTADKQRQQKERRQAAEEKKKHDKAQDEKLAQEERQRKEDAAAKKAAEKGQGQGDTKPEPKDGGHTQQSGGQGQGEKGRAVEEAIKKEQKDEQSQREKGDSKGAGGNQGDAKGENSADQQDKGGAKSGPPQDQGQQGDGKGEGPKGDNKPSDKGGDKSQGPKPQDSGADGKGRGQGEDQGTGSAKADGPPKPDRGDVKDEGKGEESRNAAAEKGQGTGANGDESAAKGQGRPEPGAGDKAAAKGESPSEAKGTPKPDGAGGEAKGTPKAGGQPQGDGGRAEAKTGGPQKAGEPGASRAEAKDDPNKRSLAKELPRWEQEVRGGDDRQSAAAEKKIEGLSRNAGEKEVRDLAQKILDEARKDRATAPALPKPPPSGDPKDGPTCDGKGGSGQDAGAAKGGKQDGTGKAEGNAKGEQGGGRGVGPGRPKEGTSVARENAGVLGGLRADEASPSPADPAHRRWAGGMQLEDYTHIDKDVLKKILKDHKMTPEELEAYLTRRRREQAATEDLPDSQNDRVGSRGAREVKADKTGASGDRTGVGEVPPEFRGSYQDYTRRQSEKK